MSEVRTVGRKRKKPQNITEEEYDFLSSGDEDEVERISTEDKPKISSKSTSVLKELVSELTSLQAELKSLREEKIILAPAFASPAKKIATGKKRGRKPGQKAKPKYLNVVEKQELKDALSHLEPSHLAEAINIMTAKCPAALIRDEESVEINFDAVDTKAFKDLNKLFMKIQRKKQKKNHHTNTSVLPLSSVVPVDITRQTPPPTSS